MSATDDVAGSSTARVHLLRYGTTLCDAVALHGFPRNWPPGHKWVSEGDAADANCSDCIIALRRLQALPAPLSSTESGIIASVEAANRTQCPLCDVERAKFEAREVLTIGVMLGIRYGDPHAVVELMCDKHRTRYVLGMLSAIRGLNQIEAEDAQPVAPPSHTDLGGEG